MAKIYYNVDKIKAQNGVHHQKGVNSHFVLFLLNLKGGETVKVNGKGIVLKKAQTLYDLLVEQQLDIHTIAVECNGEIVPKSEYKNRILKNEDTLEIVRFVNGG